MNLTSKTAEEDDIDADVVGGDLDDPPEFWRPVIWSLPLDGVLKSRQRLANQPVQPIEMGSKSVITRRILQRGGRNPYPQAVYPFNIPQVF